MSLGEWQVSRMNEYQEAIKTIKCNYPPSNYSMLCEALDMAIDALEKQTPKTPIKSDREIRYCEVWECPNCGFEWSSRFVDYCYKCGQQIDWSKED